MKKILVIATIITLILSTGMYANASESVIRSEGNYNISVSANLTSIFEITIPSVIVLNAGDVTEFQIKGKGAVSESEYLHIGIPQTVNMKAEGQYSENLKIIASDNKFTREQLASNNGGVITCSIDSSPLPNGAWSGKIIISISKEEIENP